MPARGRHRRQSPGPVSRASRAVTAGGAGLALPLVGAGAGHAATDDAWDRSAEYQSGRPHPAAGAAQDVAGAAPAAVTAGAGRAAAELAATERAAAAQAQRRAGGTRYEVVGGDSLSSIARAHDVDGGWPALYERNRGVVGADPDVIFPGQRLALENRPAPARERGAADSGQAGPRESGRQHPAEKHRPEQPAAKPAPEPEPKPEPEAAPPKAVAPVPGAGTGTPYRAAGSGWSSGYHTGVDFPVPTGTAVRAVSGGSVVSAGWAGAYGYQVVLRHDDGRYSQYAHLSAISVSSGQRVNVSQRLGRSGSTGNSTGPHLHFEVRTGPGYGTDVDPTAYLRGLGVSL